MAVSSRAVTVATTATRLDLGDAAEYGVEGLSIFNAGSATVYVGGSDVTTSIGTPVAAGEHYALELARRDSLYGIVATGTQAVRVVEVLD